MSKISMEIVVGKMQRETPDASFQSVDDKVVGGEMQSR
jgi:hypothetical protein